MKIILIGAPGAGKSTIASKLAERLKLTHIESDKIFWDGKDLLTEVDALTQKDNWILDGHITKLSDLTFSRADKFIVIHGLHLFNLFRALRRDIFHPKKAWFNLQNYHKLSEKREKLILDLMFNRKEDVLFLDNFPHLSEGDLKTFCEGLKSSGL